MRFGIERTALFGEAGERGCGIRVAKQRTRVASPGPLAEDVNGHVKPHGDRSPIEEFPRSRINECPSSGGDYADLAIDQPSDEAAFAIAKARFTETLEHFSGRIARSILDLCVAVDERKTEPLRETLTDGRFANAHQPDKDDWTIETFGQLFHGRGYTAGRKVGQKRNLVICRKSRCHAQPWS